METKKISFGFMKTKKTDNPVVEEKKEYIEFIEEKSIKVIGQETLVEEKPLVIPMKPNTLITAEKLKEIAEKAENFEDVIIKSEDKMKENVIPENENLDQMAVRELLENAQKELVTETPKLIVPINAKPIIEGKSESTLDDYESVPVQEFGMALLRGMGLTPSNESTYKQPQLRPKGLGLGADKVLTNKKNNKSKDKEEELAILKNSFVKVVTGKHSGYYGKVLSLDEDNGRVVIELTIKKETVSLNEFMVQAVTKAEFDKESKVINTNSYEEYKKNEQAPRQTGTKKGTAVVKSEREVRNRETENCSNGSNRRSRSKSRETRKQKKYSSSSEESRSRHRKREKKKYSSNDSLSSDLDNEKKVSRRRHSSSDSSSSDHRKKQKKSKSKYSKEKRDIDKKRKGKKKKRDRDRSPNYKKHRK